MSETSILPDAAAGAPPVGGPGLGFDDEPTDDRRRLMIIGGAVGAVLLIVVAYLLLHGGGGPSASTSGVVPHGTPQAVTTPTAASSGGSGSHGGTKAGTTLPRKSHTRLARDPFKPLVVDNGVAGATAGAGDTTGATVTVEPSQTAAPGTAPTTPAEGGAPSGSLGSPHSIGLVSVKGGTSAVFEVTYAHGKTFRFDVAAPGPGSSKGTVFAQEFSLLGIQGGVATVQVGDATPFDLKRGAVRVL